MKFTLMTSLLAAGIILSGCQTESTDTNNNAVSEQTSQPTTLASADTSQSSDRAKALTEERTNSNTNTDNEGTTTQNRVSNDSDTNDNSNTNRNDEVSENYGNDEGDAGDIPTDDTSYVGSEPIDGSDNPPTPASTSRVPDGWYMRVAVSAIAPSGKEYIHDTAGVFGELRESSDGKDNHDIPSFGKAVLYVLLTKVEDNKIVDYFSDYHHYDPDDQYNSERQVWTFQVKNQAGEDLSTSDINLTFSGPYNVFKKTGSVGYDEVLDTTQDRVKHFSLIDLDTHKVYRYEELQNLHLNMRGRKVRTFRMVFGGVSGSLMRSAKIQTLTAKALQQQQMQAAADRAQESTAKRQSTFFGFPPAP